jgi:hypothetical protein
MSRVTRSGSPKRLSAPTISWNSSKKMTTRLPSRWASRSAQAGVAGRIVAVEADLEDELDAVAEVLTGAGDGGLAQHGQDLPAGAARLADRALERRAIGQQPYGQRLRQLGRIDEVEQIDRRHVGAVAAAGLDRGVGDGRLAGPPRAGKDDVAAADERPDDAIDVRCPSHHVRGLDRVVGGKEIGTAEASVTHSVSIYHIHCDSRRDGARCSATARASPAVALPPVESGEQQPDRDGGHDYQHHRPGDELSGEARRHARAFGERPLLTGVGRCDSPRCRAVERVTPRTYSAGPSAERYAGDTQGPVPPPRRAMTAMSPALRRARRFQGGSAPRGGLRRLTPVGSSAVRANAR